MVRKEIALMSKCISENSFIDISNFSYYFFYLGVLVLIPNYPVVNILLTSFIFACAAHEIHSITTMLVKVLVPDNNFKVVLRNTCMFIAILIPIGIQDGMFWKEVWNDILAFNESWATINKEYYRVQQNQASLKIIFYVTKKKTNGRYFTK